MSSTVNLRCGFGRVSFAMRRQRRVFSILSSPNTDQVDYWRTELAVAVSGSTCCWTEIRGSVTMTDVERHGSVIHHYYPVKRFLADRILTVALMLVLHPSVVLCLSVTLCIVAKRCVLEQKLKLRAYRKSYIRNRLVPK